MRNVVAYDILKEESWPTLALTVREAIKNGWQPQGGVSSYFEDTFCGPRPRFMQAVVKYGEENAVV